ncbi:MAG: CHAD domain-containing protein [Nitrospirae bacterium]|nr:MAG: CHAD domain-containing protein [Nitrospirota bacterium]
MLERKRKLHIDRSFRLPAFLGMAMEPRVLTSSYYDTSEYLLAQYGISLRRRIERGRGVWQLTIPQGQDHVELEAAGGPGKLPATFMDLLFGVRRNQPLQLIAKLKTKRQTFRIHREQTPLADISIDQATTIQDGRRVGGFLELEVKLLSGADRDLDGITETLISAGARTKAFRPQLCQALGLPYPREPQPIDQASPPAEQLRRMLSNHVLHMLKNDPATRLGQDPEPLHQMRVATRRFRAQLQAVRTVLDADWVQSVRARVRWLGCLLGQVRDFDVMLATLREELEQLPESEQQASVHLLAQLEQDRAQAHDQLLDGLRSEDYLRLLDEMDTVFHGLPLREEPISFHTLAAQAFLKLRKAMKALPPHPSDTDWHRIRIRTKKARYIAELAAPTAGPGVSRFLTRAKKLQDLLGAYQDSVVIEQYLRRLSKNTRRFPVVFVLGQLVARFQMRRVELSQMVPSCWAKLKRCGKRVWLTALPTLTLVG